MKDLLSKLLSLAGYVGERLKYGAENEGRGVAVPLAASVVVKAASGRFVTLNTAGNAIITSASNTTIFGSLEGGYDVTASATAGVTKVMCNINTDTLYRIPINSGTYANTLRGVKCDLSVASSIQGAALGTTSGGHVIIVDGDVTNQKWVIVKINDTIQAKSAA